MNSAPSKMELDILKNLYPQCAELLEKVLAANLELFFIKFNGKPVVVVVARNDFPAKTPLVFNYGLMYWLALKKVSGLSLLFSDKNMAVIDCKVDYLKIYSHVVELEKAIKVNNFEKIGQILSLACPSLLNFMPSFSGFYPQAIGDFLCLDNKELIAFLRWQFKPNNNVGQNSALAYYLETCKRKYPDLKNLGSGVITTTKSIEISSKPEELPRLNAEPKPECKSESKSETKLDPNSEQIAALSLAKP
jgi:hypothetical protein